MSHTPEEIAAKAAQIQALFAEALSALQDPRVLEMVARLALDFPEISWEPVALVAAALNARRGLDSCGGAGAPVLTGATQLPLPSSSGSAARPTVCLPRPMGLAF